MIDTHCHIDLFPNPNQIADYSEENNIITIGVTNLPSHFELGFPHIKRYKKVRLALGLHPLCAENHEFEYSIFKKWVDKTSYIGEVGLDFSKEGIRTKTIQIRSFNFILQHLQGKKKFISIHSRRAEQEVFDLLINYKIPIAIFHWYSGSIRVLEQIIQAGYYLSINPAMIKSNHGRKIIDKIPPNLFLTESDGPFINIAGKESSPKDVRMVLEYISQKWNVSKAQAERQVQDNFLNIIKQIRKTVEKEKS